LELEFNVGNGHADIFSDAVLEAWQMKPKELLEWAYRLMLVVHADEKITQLEYELFKAEIKRWCEQYMREKPHRERMQ
jgi:hypothetical protein